MLNGVFLIDKELGVTSRALDNRIGKLFKIKKVGHVGTLDPLATGLMLVAVGEGTKAIPFMEDARKEYVATFKLGMLTTTLDLEGEVVTDDLLPELDLTFLQSVLDKFKGKISQIPPLTSAIKVGGVPLYKYAHKNIDFEVPAREVEIFELELVAYEHPYFTIRTLVSSGTYIRTLGNDIAKLCGTFATTTALRRTKVGTFSVNQAKVIENLGEDDIITISEFLTHIPSVEINADQFNKVKVGAQISLNTQEVVVKVYYQGKLLALYTKTEEQTFKCLRGFNL